MEYIIDVDHLREHICEHCPLITITKGVRDQFGQPLEPDSYDCPVGFDLSETLGWDGEDYAFYCELRGRK